MRTSTWVPLVERLRDGSIDPDLLLAARQAVRDATDVPDALRGVLDDDDDVASAAAALLVLTGHSDDALGALVREAVTEEAGAGSALFWASPDDLSWDGVPVAAAVRWEAGHAEVAGAVIEAVGGSELAVSAAVRAEAGIPSLEGAVLDALGGSPPVGVASAVRAEAGRADVADAVLSVLGIGRVPIREAVVAESGQAAEVADTVAARVSPERVAGWLDNELSEGARRATAGSIDGETLRTIAAHAELGRQIRGSVGAEAGAAPALWPEVAASIGVPADQVEAVAGYDGAAVAAAVRAEAGPVDLVPAVMARVRVDAQGSAASLPANGVRYAWGALGLVAAAALVVVAVWRTGPADPPVAPPEVASASLDPVQLESLDYAEDALVQVITPEDGSLIIWFDEGAT